MLSRRRPTVPYTGWRSDRLALPVRMLYVSIRTAYATAYAGIRKAYVSIRIAYASIRAAGWEEWSATTYAYAIRQTSV